MSSWCMMDLLTADAVYLLSSPAVITLRGDAAQTMTRLLLCNQPRMAAAEDVLMPVCRLSWWKEDTFRYFLAEYCALRSMVLSCLILKPITSQVYSLKEDLIHEKFIFRIKCSFLTMMWLVNLNNNTNNHNCNPQAREDFKTFLYIITSISN